MQTFNFENFFKYNPQKKITNNYLNDLCWFVGFSEGIGSWYVDSKSRRTYFIINQKDAKVLYKVRSILGFGKIYDYKTFFRFSVTDPKGTFNIIQIFNGNLVLNKSLEAFSLYLTIFNNTGKTRLSIEKQQIIILNNDKILPTTKDAWLSGFIEAEGCFSFDRRRGENLSSLRFHLTQYNELDLFNHLAAIFSVNVLEFSNDKNIDKKFLCFYLQGFKVVVLLNYLNLFPLYSEKSIMLVKFKKILTRLTDDNNHTLRRSRARFLRLIASLNKK